MYIHTYAAIYYHSLDSACSNVNSTVTGMHIAHSTAQTFSFVLRTPFFAKSTLTERLLNELAVSQLLDFVRAIST